MKYVTVAINVISYYAEWDTFLELELELKKWNERDFKKKKNEFTL